MVQDLNVLSFAPFGHLASGESLRQGQLRTVSVTRDTVVQYAVTEPLHLDYDTGMSILAVAQSDGDFVYFYLDKPVCLNPGIRFSIVPYQEACSVTMSAEDGHWPQESVPNAPIRELALSRQLQVARVYTFFYHEKERGFFFRGEAHSMLELTYVDKGSIHSVADGLDLVLDQGDMAVYGPDQWHMQYADPDCAPSYITVTFDLVGNNLSSLFNRKFRTPQKAVQLLQAMLRERDTNDAYSADMLMCLLNQLLLTILRESDNTAEAPLRTANAINSENEVVGHAQRFISDNIRLKLSVPAVAREVGVSPSYLTALFHKNLQISPGEYIRRAKLQESKVMIREGKMNFTEIAQLLQYSTVHHFSRQFKEKFGITPTEYARSIR